MNVQRHKLFCSVAITCGVLLLFVLAIGSVAAGGQGVISEFEAVDVACDTFEGDGDINVQGVVLSDDKRIAGTSFIEITFVGQRVLVDATFVPDAFDGTWIAPGHSTDTPAPVIHKGYGTGVFEGQSIMIRARVLDENELANLDLPCEPVGPVVKLVGQIME